MICVFFHSVYDSVVELHSKTDLYLMGIYMGEEEYRWPIDEIINKKKGFASDLERTIQLKEPVYLKVRHNRFHKGSLTLLKFIKNIDFIEIWNWCIILYS